MLDDAGAVIKPEISPGCSGLSLIGRIRRDPLAYFLNLGVKNGPYAWLSLMGSPVLFLNDARAIEYVFSENDKNYHKGKYNEGLRPLLGYGVFLSEDDLWKKQRRDTAPVFAGGNFPEFTRRIAEATEAMLKRWEPRVAAGELVDMNAETMKLTLDVVLRALFHEDSEDALLNMKDALGTMLRMAEQRIWSAVNLPLPVVLKLPKYARTMKFLDALTAEFISRRRENKSYPEDLLSRLIDCHTDTPEDRKLLRDNVLSFLLAGHETTANGLAWTFYELGRHTTIREKVIAEVDAATQGAVPDMDMIKKMNYTRQTFDEALRLYPPVWTMSRRALKDDLLPLEDGRKLSVPRDTTVMLCTYSVHRREKYWRDPESFTPERFSQEEIQRRPKFAWFPFGGGPRLCLGFKFAEVESMVAMAMVYQKYDLALVPGQQIRPEPIITLRPDRPVWFRVTHRNRNCTVGEGAPSAAPQGAPRCPFGH
jgi:cytochrome P450